MLTPDELKTISGVIVGIGFLALVHQMYWQVRIGLIDRQAKSAFLFLLITTAIMGQLAASYMGGPTFGNTTHGVVCFFAWVGSLIWWSYCTLRHNASVLRRSGHTSLLSAAASTGACAPVGHCAPGSETLRKRCENRSTV